MNISDDLYEILQVHHAAEAEVIEAAYKRLLRMYHPDVNTTADAHEYTVRLNRAFEILRDPVKRAEYDRTYRRDEYYGRDRPQHARVQEDDLRSARWQHSREADLKGEEQLSALKQAVENGDIELVRAFMSAGTNPNATYDSGTSLLHIAAGGRMPSHADIVWELLDSGADFEAINNNDFTPLGLAAAAGAVDSIRALISAGADIEGRCFNDYTPLHLAAAAGEANSILALIALWADIEARNITWGTPLHLAASNGKVNSILALIGRWADIEARNEEGFTPLHLASATAKVNSMDVLIRYGADLEAKSDEGSTPLYLAVALEKVESVRALIGAGADVNARLDLGSTPLHLAAATGKVKSMPVLISAGANVDARDNYGGTPLHPSC